MTVDPLREELRRCEEALARRDPEGILGGLETLLADDVVEFGRSGRAWSRQAIIELLAAGPVVPPDALELEGFVVDRLAEDVALVTYRAAGANRSSIWVRRQGRWQLRLHQGTPSVG